MKPNKYKRSIKTRKPKKTFLIVCEGTKTEPNYFRSFPVLSATIEVVGTGRNTLSLVHYAEEMLRSRAGEVDEIWLVFDKDSFSAVQFNNAVAFCEAHREEGFRVAYSNEAFELWYVLHVMNLTHPVSRFDYARFLNQFLDEPYRKNRTDIYLKLLPYQPIAIKRAEELYAKRTTSPAKDNPSTTVFQLVEELNAYKMN